MPAPLTVLARLTGAHRVLLDSGGGGQHARWSLIAADPIERVVHRAGSTWHWRGRWRRVDVDPLELVGERLAALGEAPGVAPFRRGALGVLGYGLRHLFEGRLPSARRGDPFPDLWFGMYPGSLAFDHRGGRWIAGGEWVAPPEVGAGMGAHRAGPLRCELPRAAYLAALARVAAHIAAGDVYQVNLTRRFCADFDGDPLALYAALRRTNPAPFAAYLELEGGQRVLSSSPERFVRLEGGVASTQPIKGTRPRGADPATDAALAAELLASPKDAAELAMIVDLLRNDLGRVARWGGVRVEERGALESYATVHHLVARVVAELAPGRGWADLLRATFPGGSITGAPKIRAMQLIADLEPVERGVYTGAIGYVDASGAMDTSIAIRTLLVDRAARRVWFSTGGGVVADSDPEAEHRECLDKAAPLAAALGARL